MRHFREAVTEETKYFNKLITENKFYKTYNLVGFFKIAIWIFHGICKEYDFVNLTKKKEKVLILKQTSKEVFKIVECYRVLSHDSFCPNFLICRWEEWNVAGENIGGIWIKWQRNTASRQRSSIIGSLI